VLKNHNFTYSPILLPRQKKANPPNLAKLKPNQDQFLLQPNFLHLVFDALVTMSHQDCTKIITSLIHQFCYQGKKSNPQNMAKTKPNQDQFLLQPKFSLLVFDAFVRIPHQDCTKTITSLIHQFCYQGRKRQSTELGKPKPHQDQFLVQPNFSHLICYAFVTIPHQDCTKTIISLIHQFFYQGKKIQSTELG